MTYSENAREKIFDLVLSEALSEDSEREIALFKQEAKGKHVFREEVEKSINRSGKQLKRNRNIIKLKKAAPKFAATAAATSAIDIAPLADVNTYTLALSFSGSTAYCDVTINGATGTTKIDNCTVTLKESGGSTVKEWKDQSATGSTLNFSKTASPVSSGKSYTLSFSATVHRNGNTETVSGSITKTYS